MTDDRAKILETIKKLLSMAEHATSNEHEALAAAKRAEALMRKHNIQYAEAIATEIKSGVGMVTEDVIATAKDNGTAVKEIPSWAQQIAVRVGSLYDAPVRLQWITTRKGSEMAIRFHGYEHDVKVAAWTFEVLVAAVNRVCKNYRKNPHYLAKGRTVMNAYRLGVMHSVLGTLNGMIAEKDQVVTSSSTALVLVKRDAIEKKFGAFTYRQTKAPSIMDRSAYHSGREDGRQIEVQRAIEEPEELKVLEAAR